MENIFDFIGGLIIVALVAVIVYLKKKQKNTNPSDEREDINIKNLKDLPYEKTFLLTKNEWHFYKTLKPIADELGYTIIAKIRLADLIKVKSNMNKHDYYSYFAKIKAKHIDFALCNPDNLLPVLIIELDDQSHHSSNRMTRDEFVDNALRTAGYKILHTYGTGNLKECITEHLK